MSRKKYTKDIVSSFVLVMIVLALMPSLAEERGDDAYVPGLLDKVEKRGAIAMQEGLSQPEYNPDQSGLMKTKQTQRVGNMGYQRQDALNRGYGDYGRYYTGY